MKYEIKLSGLPLGVLATSVKKGEVDRVQLLSRVLSDEPDFAHRMDIVTGIINQLPKEPEILCSTIDNFLAVIQPDKKCMVYVNGLDRIALVHKKGAGSAGQEVYDDQIVDVKAMEFEGVEIPEDAGVIMVLSYGWRKVLFYDLIPLFGEKLKRPFDIRQEFGQCQNLLFFHHLHNITKRQYDVLFSQRWFPFTGLRHATIKSMLLHVDSGGNCDDLLDTMSAEVKAGLPEWIKSWKSRASFNNHMELIAHAADEFMQEDYKSSTGLLYPKIEGVLRSIGANLGDSRPSQPELSKIALKESGISKRTFSALLPWEFSEYLGKVYFAGFDSGETPPMSRNTVAHGVAPAEGFSEKESVIAFLILHQIFYHQFKPA
ncbi:MAG: hypothetical protein MPK09_05155 [Gammaproteobacteria bacterium]|nr:hypothetical protein [Gammaproteobacteria bacterium]